MNDATPSRDPSDQAGNKLVSRRRFMGCAAVAGAATVGATATGLVATERALATSQEKNGELNNDEALRELLLRSQKGASERRLPVLDLHSHPSIKAYMFKQRFWKRHEAQPGFTPVSLTVDMDALINGGAGVFLCTTYVVEREFFSDVIPMRVLGALYPRAHHIATAPLDVLAMEYLDDAEDMVSETRHRRGEVIELAKSYSDMKRIASEGKVCMIHAMEGAHHLNGKLERVDDFFNRGVCMLTLPHLYPNKTGGCVTIMGDFRALWWMKGSFSDKYRDNSGLSPWGRELVDKLLDVGIVVDMVHGTQEYRKQVIDIAKSHPKKRPVAISHVGIRKDPSKGMGPSPEDVRAIADMGGVVGLMMIHHAYGGASDPVDAFLNAVDYLIKNGGDGVVAIGSDFDGYPVTPKGLASPRDFSAVRKALLSRYTEEQTAKFLYGNAERLLSMGWGKA